MLLFLRPWIDVAAGESVSSGLAGHDCGAEMGGHRASGVCHAELLDEEGAVAQGATVVVVDAWEREEGVELWLECVCEGEEFLDIGESEAFLVVPDVDVETTAVVDHDLVRLV